MANGFLVNNNASTTLAGAISNSDTIASLQSGTGALFPSPGSGQWAIATLGAPPTQEIVKITSRSGDSVTIVRAQEGSTAQSWSVNSAFAQLITAGELSGLLQIGHNKPPPIVSTSSGTTFTASTNVTLTTSLTAPSDGYALATGALNLNAAAGGNITTTLSNNYNGASSSDTSIYPQTRQISVGVIPSGTSVTFTFVVAPGSGVSTTGDAFVSYIWVPVN